MKNTKQICKNLKLNAVSVKQKTKRILFDKLKEMSEIKFEDCAYNCGNNEYAITCSAMGEIAKIILDIT